jgi:hypothetical protein
MEQAIQYFLYVCGALVTVGGAVAVISKMFGPYRQWKKQTMHCEARFKHDQESLERLEEVTRKTLSAVCVLLEHASTGNSVEKCKNERDELIRFLANK